MYEGLEQHTTDPIHSKRYPSHRRLDHYCFQCVGNTRICIDELKHRNKRVYAYGKCLQCQTPAARLISGQKYEEILYLDSK